MNERDEETLRNLPQILEGIVMLDRLERPNPLTSQHIAVEGGPLAGSTQFNDGTHWQGDDWDVEVDGGHSSPHLPPLVSSIARR